ncbi:hypothetical protein SELMODRAFT_111624 [Selaginella moellendorffii]|uniref:FCP1 homology domain-containing protein n=1 Tax=Selaginella moellendorffii TaxID=88036 RepID=D8S8P9_SELML|nr:hypothetical protein SELMODRAFT_111624 [Selaginella moellendorffii]
MAKLYKIVVFTVAMQYYADKILDKLDPEELITHRLYRCVLQRRGNDDQRLVTLGSQLEACGDPHSFSLQPRNGIPIPALIFLACRSSPLYSSRSRSSE